MKKTALYQWVIGLFGMSVLAVLFFACPVQPEVQESQKAAVSFTVTDNPERTVLPQVSLADTASYTLLGGKTGTEEKVLVEKFTGTGTSVSLDPGTWNFTLNAYNSSGGYILQGKVQNKQINLTGTNQVSFSLSALKNGTGAIRITFKFPESAGITGVSVNGDIGTDNFSLSGGGNFVYIKNGVGAGDYFINFEFYSEAVLRVVISELVLVRSSLTSSKDITLEEKDLKLKPLLTGTVSITGIAEVGQTLAAYTGLLDGSGTISYLWKRGGTEIGTNSTYIVQSADAGFTITVTVTRSGYVGSVTSVPTVAVTVPELSTPGLAFTLINNNTAYSVSKGTATAAEVVIPAVYDGKPVTEIAETGFRNYTDMTSVRIPNSVISIGTRAFYSCHSLTSVTIPNSVTVIGQSAFDGCSRLTSVTIPNSVTSIGEMAFSWCQSLTSVIIGNSVTSIGKGTFNSCVSLTSVTIGNSVTSIGDSAFVACYSLTSITIPESVTTIGDWAFYDCTSLTSITIPESVTTIGDSVFSGCTSLTSVTIPGSVTTIGQWAFSYCTSLTAINVAVNNVNYSSEQGVLYNKIKTTLIQYPAGKAGTPFTIPNSVTTIGQRAFSGCTSLASVTIPNSVTTIGQWAFSYCTSLASVTIPDSVTTIGQWAFSYCTSLTAINVAVNNVNYSSEQGVLYNKIKTTLIQYPAGKAGTTFTIPNSVTTIGDSVFSGCTSLTSVTFQGTITSANFANNAFGTTGQYGYIGDLRTKYLAGGTGTYTRPNTGEGGTWTKQ